MTRKQYTFTAGEIARMMSAYDDISSKAWPWRAAIVAADEERRKNRKTNDARSEALDLSEELIEKLFPEYEKIPVDVRRSLTQREGIVMGDWKKRVQEYIRQYKSEGRATSA